MKSFGKNLTLNILKNFVKLSHDNEIESLKLLEESQFYIVNKQ